MINKFLNSKWFWIALCALLPITLVPLVVISFYSRPCVDDFSYSAELHNYIQGGSWNIFGWFSNVLRSNSP